MNRSHITSHRVNIPGKISCKKGLAFSFWIVVASLLWIYASPVL